MKRWWLICVAVLGLTVPSAWASTGLKSVTYRGYTVRVPDSWPVINLAAHPSTCVRFDRPAVYVGTPSADEACPAHAVGRSQAILLEPSATGARALRSSASTGGAPVSSPGGSGNAHAASTIYTGKGFDTCSTPSTTTMSAWSASPYRAIGVYIGGINSACAQPNLTSSWVAAETAAGWHLIPTYVGPQGAGSCGGTCSTITPSKAAAQGKGAAQNAVSEAAGLGIPAGNPIYYDMEAYNTGGSSSATVLKFLSAWTAQLHAQGYLSGVYSSGASGIADLVASAGKPGFHEPDEIWVADWNGKATTSDPYLPSGDWANHQRIHQYSGGHNERHGGITLNIDNDYLDAATADTHGVTSPPACVVPKLKHKTLPQARRALQKAHCALGKVKRPKNLPAHHKPLHVVAQSPKAGKHEAAGYKVSVRMAR